MIQKRFFYGLSVVIALAAASFLSGCGGGSSAPAPGGTLTGSAAVGSSAVSRVGRAGLGNLRDRLNSIRPTQRSANLITRGRQGLDFDEELGLYYNYTLGSSGVYIELFEDSAGQRPAGEVIFREDPSSYETIINITAGAQRQRAYFKLAETSDPSRLKLRARYEDPRTGERKSIEGDLIIQPLNDTDDDSSFDDSWTDEFNWWDNDDYYYGDDFFESSDGQFFGEDEFFRCPDETNNPNLNDIEDFDIARFEGTITYEGCGQTVVIQGTLDYATGVLTGQVAIGEGTTGSVECDYDTNQGRMTLDTPQGQVQIVFNGDVIEARYPDGRIERVDIDQWANPCAGVSRSSRASFPNSAPHTLARSALAKVGG